MIVNTSMMRKSNIFCRKLQLVVSKHCICTDTLQCTHYTTLLSSYIQHNYYCALRAPVTYYYYVGCTLTNCLQCSVVHACCTVFRFVFISVQIQCLLAISCNFLQKILDFIIILVYTTISADGPFSQTRSHTLLFSTCTH